MDQQKIFKTIYQVAKKEKVDVYVVGGFVRDELLGKENPSANAQGKKDLDFVVTCPQRLTDLHGRRVGSGLEFAKKFDEAVKQTGSLIEFPDFDTARYIITPPLIKGGRGDVGQIELEFAGARTEKYDEKSRKPKVEATTLEEDLKRRDFTVNTMAVDVRNAKYFENSKLSEVVIDPLGGQVDLKKKLLRTPLDPDSTFSDDPLRMMRAARFASQLGFIIEANTYSAMERNASRLKIISAERIKEELFKIFTTTKPSIGLRILYDTGLMDVFMPEVGNLKGVDEIFGQQHKDVLEHTFKVIDNLAERTDNVLLRVSALFHDIAKPQTKKFERGRGWTFDMHEHLGKKMVQVIGKRLKFSTDESKYLAKLVRWHQHPIALMDDGVTDSAVRRLIVNLGDELTDLLNLCRSDITTGNPLKKTKRLKNYDYLENRIKEVIEKDNLRAFQSPFRGDEIMTECGLKPGPTVGKIKKALEEAILEGIIPNDYEATKKYFLKLKDEMMVGVEEWEKL
ncbi:MAG: tRNA nucleotidyltransferase [Candidatus Magasanikbacteria bacterium GW2011_GWC2_37_14]|uniref:tRNA nucleotidyltransferase n=1 Tax=Candidatus Magasanikbacteria bacterium GW2011_GWC2_37_14 TaxID=1619046 RepID=A0A0G0GE32_9BACT|nr:MAG: tRNA nucleotidyltransferase [Candidatus Magasanikbacteria bacterium GW2011_GWC2_37_14]